jgi:anaerobic selenocysteine-containing dehydrogenase
LNRRGLARVRRREYPMTQQTSNSGQPTPQHSHGDSVDQPSRRRFLTWAGQLAAGISLIGVGLGIADPAKVLAAGQSPHNVGTQTAHGAPAGPDCIQCPTGCVVNSYTYSPKSCPDGCPYKVNFTQYFGGCAVNGQCPGAYNGSTCATSKSVCSCS